MSSTIAKKLALVLALGTVGGYVGYKYFQSNGTVQANLTEEKKEASTQKEDDLSIQPEKKADADSKAADPSALKIAAELPWGEKITVGQIQESAKNLPERLKSLPFPKIYEALLTRLVDMKLVLKAAEEQGITKDAEVLKRAKDGQEAILQKSYLDKEIEKLITDAILKEKYEEVLKAIPKEQKEQTEAKVSQVTFETKEQAEAALKDIRSGAKTFDDFVKAKNAEENSKTKAGELGYLRRTDFPKEYADVVFKTAKGALVNEVIKLGELGFTIMRVEDVRPVEMPKFEDVKGEIQKAVSPEYAVKVIEALRKDSGVKRFGLDGKPLVETKPEDKEKEKEDAKADDVDVSKIDPKMVVAEFKTGEKIVFSEILESLKSLPEQLKAAPVAKIYEALLNRVVDMKLISEAARKDGLDKDPAVLERQKQGHEAIIQKAFLDSETKKLITAEKIKEKYGELVKMMPKDNMSIRLRHILVKTKQEAEDLIRKINASPNKVEAFDASVSASIDDQTKENKGDLGYVNLSELPKEFRDIFAKATKGVMLSEPVNLGEVGYSIIRVEDKRPVEAPQLEEVKGEISRMLSNELALNVLKDLRTKFKTVKYDLDGKILEEKKEEAPAAPSEKASS
jgi:peptidyl-prolyl cis-trans isomerase C